MRDRWSHNAFDTGIGAAARHFKRMCSCQILRPQQIARMLVLLSLFRPPVLRGQTEVTNLPPAVSIVWPQGKESFTTPNAVKIKVQALDPDGSIAEVRVFVETNLIGVVTNPPFNVLWLPHVPCDYCDLNLKAVAVDNLGAKRESAPVMVHYSITQPPFTYIEIVSPSNGTVVVATGTFTFSAELLASYGDAWPVEFFAGTNSLGRVEQGGDLTATTPPASLTVSNLAEGEYKLSVKYPNRSVHLRSAVANYPGGYPGSAIAPAELGGPVAIRGRDLLPWPANGH